MKNKSKCLNLSAEQPLPKMDDTEKIRTVFSGILFWFLAIFLLFVYLGAKEIRGSEDRWAEIVRQMQITGDYFHPSINGRPYFDKPLLSYWLIALASAITGRLDETVLRLPSAIAGLLALFGTINLGKRLFSKQQAMTAGWVLLGTYGFIFWARLGEADMENLAAIILAVAWYWARRDRPGFFSYIVFYLICFLGAHTKGMATIAVPILVVLPDLIWEKRWKSYLSVSHFLALALGLSLYLAPFLYSEMTRTGYKTSGLGMAFRENITRYFQPFDHKEPFYIYFYHLPRLLFPWIVLFVGAVWTFYRNFRQLRWPAKWLAISTGLIFLFFTLSGSRRSYYVLPILPFCALMVSQYLVVERKEKSKRIILGIQTWIFVVIMALEILSPLLWPVLQKSIGFEAPGELRLATFILGLLALICFIPNIFRASLLSRLLGTEQRLARLIAICIIIVGGFLPGNKIVLKPLIPIKLSFLN